MFNRSLLERSIDDRIEYFKNFVVAHPRMIETITKIEKMLTVGDSNNMLLVCGPSGVGKTTLRKKIEEKIYKQNLERMKEDKSFIPFFSVEAIAPEDTKFDWKDFYIRSLIALNEPLVDHKISVIENTVTKSIEIKNSQSRRTLRRSLERAINYRNPTAIFVEEGQHFMKVKSGSNFLDQMDRLKSLASTTNTPIIIFGTYQLLEFNNWSAQLIKRGININFPRYKSHNSDQQIFRSILWTLQKHLPLEEEPDLIKEYEYFYEHSIGCIGLLQPWLLRTLTYNLKLNPNLKTLSLEMFKEFELSISQCIIMAKEAIEGEKDFMDDGNYLELRELLDLSNNENDEVKFKEKKEVKKRRPGERKPMRDTVG
jgi:GTPase SAR1 family protein